MSEAGCEGRASAPFGVGCGWQAALQEKEEKKRKGSGLTLAPGVVARPVGDFSNSADYQYQTLRCNVDLLKLIQLGISFTDATGSLKPGVCTWQFNMKFDLELDMYAQDSIDLLQRSGIDFEKHRDMGIDVENFAELLISSGLVLNPKIRWIAFHGGYDFAYLLRCMMGANLPAEESEFFNAMSIWFPCVYDIKHLMQARGNNFNGGLNDLADMLQVVRIGPQHQVRARSCAVGVWFANAFPFRLGVTRC